MFATAITACGLSKMDIHLCFLPSAVHAAAGCGGCIGSTVGAARVDRVNQRPRRAQAVHRQPVR
jgi:hypothetical protein